jgi:hypothetical protein
MSVFVNVLGATVLILDISPTPSSERSCVTRYDTPQMWRTFSQHQTLSSRK